MKKLINFMFVVAFIFFMGYIGSSKVLATDSAAPKVLGIKPVNSEVIRPGVAAFDVQVYSEDVSIERVDVLIQCDDTWADNHYIWGDWEGSGKYSGSVRVNIPLSSNNKLGIWTATQIIIHDSIGNAVTYFEDGNDYYYYENNNYNNQTFMNNKSQNGIAFVNLKDEFDYYKTVSLSNPNLIKFLNDMAEGQAIRIGIDSASNDILKKEAFDAIKGKDKTLVLYNNSYQWIINGKDVVNATKDINVNLSISKTSENEFDTQEDAISLNFYPNGILPARSEIRIKSDYLYNTQNIKGKLYLYYIDNNRPVLQNNPDFDTVFDGTNKWCHLKINHNSKYIISGSKVNSKTHVVDMKLTKVRSGVKSFTVKWKKPNAKKIKYIDGYQIQYSTKKNFKKSKIVSIKKGKKSVKVKKLKSGKKYYVRIRSYNKTGKIMHTSKWSSVKKVKVK